ncbi:hypothetical protein KIN20_020096 [Parelaphostrongylus tenuis]|uniref:GRIP domain-containing protein n=1 Tax=Parelaphostrongylus tenuis TaxID=148309 RepID=A0AAD5MLY6_PARTN|nr:hypothetical protein KIN20_020096 [Parelaphostrongylus tenuis]
MFKGLKSKLEVEAKKLQASLQQSSEQFSQQFDYIRGTSSEAGSEGGSSISRRFLNSVVGSSPAPQNRQDSPDLFVGDTLIEEIRDDLLDLDSSSRQRRLSCSSVHSTESSLSELFQSVPGLSGTTLEIADSDVETLDEYCSGSIKAASKDQISNMLSRLQGRASHYKDKYRDLTRKYNGVITENNKCKTLLAQTQDKAFARIEKLKSEKKALSDKLREMEESRSKSPVDQKLQWYEEMLNRCKREIEEGRAKVKELSIENEKLSLKVTESESMAIVDQVANEWKQRIEKVEKEWTERANKNDTDHAIQLATTKAEMHAALEEKDKEIESWRSKCRTLEIQDGQANERWQKKVDELVQVVQALEVEKADMVVKLSEAKQQGVKAVLDEEEEKREKLVAEFQAKEKAMRMEFETTTRELENMKDEEIQKLKSELGNIQNSCDFQSDMSAEIEGLRTQLKEMDERRREEIEKHQSELTSLMKEHDEIVMSTRQQQIIELDAVTTKFERAREEAQNLRIKNDALEKQLEELEEAYTLEKRQLEVEEICVESNFQQAVCLAKSETDVNVLRSDEDLGTKLLENDETATRQTAEAENIEKMLRSEISELRAMLESRSVELDRVQTSRDELEAELAAARDFSSMYEHLKSELEKSVLKRQKKTLEDDRAMLRGELSDLEKSCEQGKDERLLLHSSPDDKTGRKVLISDTVDSLADMSEHTAAEMDTADELRQLRAEIAHLHDVNEQLAAKLHQMEIKSSEVNRNADVHSENIRLNEELSRNLKEIEVARNQRVALEKELSELRALSELEREYKRDSHGLLEEQRTTQNEVKVVDNQASQTEESTNIEYEDMSASSVDKLAQKEENEEVVRLRRELDATKAQEQEARALYLDTESKCEQLQSRIDELMMELGKVNGDVIDLRARAECAATEPDLQNQLGPEASSISRNLANEEVLVSLQKELEMAVATKLELEAKVSALEFDLSDSRERLEEAAKVAEVESERSLARLQELHEELETQRAQTTDLRLQLELEEAVKDKELSQAQVITELRDEIDKLQHQQETATTMYEEKLRLAESEIMALKASEDNATKSLVENQGKLIMIEEELHAMEKSREYERLEGDRRRCEYEKALEKLNSDLIEANNRIQLAKPIENECERLKMELSEIKKQCEDEIARQKKESESAIRDLKSKAEKKLGKIKAATDKEVTTVKADFALKIDELQRTLSERNCLIDKMVIEKAQMEQKYIEQQEMENELRSRREKEIEENVGRRVVELEAENLLLGEENAELVKQKEESKARIQEAERNVKELEDKIRFLLDEKENSAQKAVEKQETENKKAFRELQKESCKPADEVISKQSYGNIEPSLNHETDEELEMMRRKLNDTHKEVDELREANSKLEHLLRQCKTYQSSPAVIKVNDNDLHEGLGFSDPAEAEYLKNVLYRYMCSREDLGKEAVTLARVIGTVAKFSKSEMDHVISREESRVAGWVGGTVSHVLTGR